MVCVSIARFTRHVTPVSYLPVLPMLSTRAAKETANTLRSLVHLLAGSCLMVQYYPIIKVIVVMKHLRFSKSCEHSLIS